MTTYQYNLTMPAVSPSAASGSYPVAIADSTYIPADTMIFKLNDTVRIKVTHPLGYEIRLSVADAFGGDPNPTSPATATYPINSGGPTSMPNDIGGWFPNNTVFGLTWSGTFAGGATAATDHLTRWYFHGRDAAFPNGSGSHSAEARLRKVVYPTFSVSPTSVIQGGSVTFTSGAITGITASGNFGNRLYVSIFNSSNQLITSTGSSGVSFDSSSVFFGKVGTSDLNTVMTAGSSLPAGLYHAYLTHFNAATLLNNSSGVGNRFIGSEQRVAGPIYFTVGASADTTPNAFNFGANVINTALNQLAVSPIVTISGINAATSVSVTNAQYRINGGSFVTGTSSITNGQTIQLLVSGSGSPSTNVDSVVTIGGVVGTNTTNNASYWRVTSPGSAADTTPDAFQSQLTSTPYPNRALNQTVESDIVTMAGTTAGSASSISVSGTAANWRSRANSSSSFTAYTTASGTISAGYQFQFKFNAHAANSITSTATINVGGTQGTISASTVAASGGSSGPGGGGAASGNYGLEVKNASGLVTFSPSARTTNFVNSGYGTLNAGAQTADLPAEGMTTNNATDIAVLVNVPNGGAYGNTFFSVQRLTDKFRITNTSSAQIDYDYVVVR
jgi:hypothetical protein